MDQANQDTDNKTASSPQWGSALRALLIVLLLGGLLLIGGRGVMRALLASGDLRMLYSAGAVWIDGGNPYLFDEVIAVFRGDGGDPEQALTPRDFVTLYPPSSLPVFAPLGMFDFQQAKVVLVLVNLLGMVLVVRSAVALSGLDHDRKAALWLLALVMLLMPVSSTIAMGQCTIPLVAGLLQGLIWVRRGRVVLAGVVIGLVTAVKPQLAGLLVLWLAWSDHWRGFFAACAVGFGLIGVGVLRMELAGADWLHHLLANLQDFKDGGNGDPRQSNPAGWWRMMNLPVMLHTLTDSRAVVAVINWAVFALLMLGVLVCGHRQRRSVWADGPATSDFLLAPSVLLICCLLPVYHRHYDAVTLIVPLCWLVMRWREGRMTGVAWLVAAALLAFYLPNVPVLIELVVNPRLPEAVAESAWWRFTAMSLLTWALLAMAVGLLWALRHEALRVPALAPRDTANAV